MANFVSYQVPANITGPNAPVKGEAPKPDNVEKPANEVKPEAPATKPDLQVKPPASESKPGAPQRPVDVPEKFWKDGKVDYSSWAKSYKELEQKQSSPKPEAKAEEKPADKPASEEKPVTPPAGETYIPGVTVEMGQKYSSELEKGSLSPESYAELAKLGYPKAMVDNYVKGINADKAEQLAVVSEMQSLAGGETGYGAMTDWMQSNLTEADLVSYNEAMTSGKKAVIKQAVIEMHAKYTEATGVTPKLLSGVGNNPPAGDVFRSSAEVARAMKDPRYKTDEAYRRDVAAKISRSKY